MSGLRKRSLAIAGHRTSVSLEEPFWEALKEIAAGEGRPARGQFGAHRGEEAVAVQPARAVALGQQIDMQRGLEAGRGGVE